MTTRIHWKMLMPFVVVPALSFGLFIPIYFKLLNSDEVPSNGLIIPLGIFGTLGLWLTLTMIFRAKRITITDYTLKIERLFTFRTFDYKRTDIAGFNITLQSNQFYDYLVLQFKTTDNKIHSIVSYEFTRFDDIVDWIRIANIPKGKIGLWDFVVTEYGIPFLIAFTTIVAMLYPLALR
jgi:hypothetical protein